MLVKKLEIEETKTTFITSVLKVVNSVVLVFLISNFFTNKNSQRRELSAVIQLYFRIHTSKTKAKDRVKQIGYNSINSGQSEPDD